MARAPSLRDVRLATRAIVEAVNAGEPFLSREVETLAAWLGIDYAPPYDPDLDGNAENADEHEIAQHVYAVPLRAD